MSDKTMPPTTMYCYDYTEDGDEEIWVLEGDLTGYKTCTEYTLVHNNPDYHVIKKSDVDGDEMAALSKLDGAALYAAKDKVDYAAADKFYKILKNAIIAQSDADKCVGEDTSLVRIPRKVLESMINPDAVCITDYTKGYQEGYHMAINNVLNYKPTTVGEERSDGEGDDE